MAHSGSGTDAGPLENSWFHPGHVAALSRRLGLALVGAAVPAAFATVLVAVVHGGVDVGFLQWVGTAMDTSVRTGTGLDWGFHVSALTGFAGAWALGFALLVEGYFGIE